MEESILTSTKKLLGISESYEAFDLDVITHINSAFFTLQQLGVGPDNGFVIEDATALWGDFVPISVGQSAIKQYVWLRARLAFDPPTTSFTIEAYDKIVKELEWRMNVAREYGDDDALPGGGDPIIIDGGPAEGWD